MRHFLGKIKEGLQVSLSARSIISCGSNPSQSIIRICVPSNQVDRTAPSLQVQPPFFVHHSLFLSTHLLFFVHPLFFCPPTSLFLSTHSFLVHPPPSFLSTHLPSVIILQKQGRKTQHYLQVSWMRTQDAYPLFIGNEKYINDQRFELVSRR